MRVSVGVFGCALLTTVLSVGTRTVQAQTLPPPPLTPSPLPTTPIPSRSPQYTLPPATNERVFTAPSVDSVQSIGGYRVIVDNDSPVLLQQVRLVQPDAFIQNFGGRRVIQAGLYSSESAARRQVSRLASVGVDSRITTRSGGSDNPTRGYYAVVPGNELEVQEFRNRAVRLGVSRSLIRVRDRPRGTHMAVGPFADQREAEQLVRYLRDRGRLDARLFFNR